MVRLVVVDMIASMIVVEEVGTVGMVVGAATTTAIVDLHAMMTASVVHTDVATTTDLEALTDTPQVAATIVTAAVVTNTVVEVTPMAEMVDDPEATAMLHLEIHASLTAEPETKNTAPMIGTPAVKCGPLTYTDAEHFVK